MLVPLGAWPAQAAEPSVSINDLTIQEPSYGTTTATFTVSLSEASADDVSVRYRVLPNAAGVQEIYGNLTIGAGQVEGSIPVTVPYRSSTTDTTFSVRLLEVTGATVADAVGVATVLNTTPGGSFVCQAIERDGAAGTGQSAGSPDGECQSYWKQWDNGKAIITDYTRVDLPTAFALVQDVTTSHEVYPPGNLSMLPWARVSFRKAYSSVRVRCGGEETYQSLVAGVSVLIAGEGTFVLGSSETTEYQSIRLGNGWGLELNVTETVGSGDVRFIRQTAIRLTAPNGLTTNFAVAEVGPTGNPCV